MSTLEDYKALLHKARDALPENMGNRERWTLSPPDVIKEGRMTILRNFRDLVNGVRREEDDLAKYIFQQLGTAGQIDGDRLIMTGNVSHQQVAGRLDDYVSTYVQCSECGSPDTKLTRQERVLMLACEACGAQTPVKARKGQRKANKQVIREGAVVDVEIHDNGPRGEGLGELQGYQVIVPGTPKGQTVKIRITRIAGTKVFGEIEA